MYQKSNGLLTLFEGLTKGQDIPVTEFVRLLFAAKEAVLELKRTFRLQIRIDVIVKSTNGTNRFVELDAGAAEIDALVTIRYLQD